MTAIYCAKCRNITNTKQERRETTTKRRNRLSDICVTRDTKKDTFVNIKWKIMRRLLKNERMPSLKNSP